MRKLMAALAALVVCAAFSSTNANAGWNRGGCYTSWSFSRGHLVWICPGGYGDYDHHGYGVNGYGNGDYQRGVVVRHSRVVVHRHYESGGYAQRPRVNGCNPCGQPTCNRPAVRQIPICTAADADRPRPLGEGWYPGYNPDSNRCTWIHLGKVPVVYGQPEEPPPPRPPVILRSRD